jgi:flagellin
MSRINTNIASMNAITQLVGNNSDLNTSLQRLSSGLRINAGRDDPAGLIASESLRAEIRGIEKGISNSIRASSVIATAEGALNEISSLLLDIQGLLVETANKGALSSEEIDANQLQVDSAINSIDRIANSTQFNGKKLLNGTLAYTMSGIDAAEVAEASINSSKLIDGAEMTVDVNILTAAETGTISADVSAVLTAALTIQVGSGRGTTELTFAIGTSAAEMASAVNAVKEITGVSALASGTELHFDSVDFGTDAFASVEILQASTNFDMNGATTTKDFGVDVSATINGASATGDGKNLTIRTSMLDADIELTVAQATSATSTSFTITGGGSDFAIGAQVDAIGLEPVGIQSVATSQLGNSTDGFLNTLKSGAAQALKGSNLVTAQNIVDSAVKDISILRGRLGAFQRNILDTNVNSLRVTLENVTAAESAIRDADFATETAALTRAQILVQANTSILSLANSAPQSVLALLG